MRRERRCIEQMFGTMEKDVEIYNVKLNRKQSKRFHWM